MNKYIGSSLDSFLEKETIFPQVSAKALKRVITWQIKNFLESNRLTKSSFAERMKTSRSQLDRLLDPENTTISLKTLVNTAHAMGKHVELNIIANETRA